MNRNEVLLLVLLLASLSLAACSGPKGVVLPVGGGNGSVAVTLVADSLPANPSILSFQVTITSITFTPASGTPTTVNLNPALTVDLMRLQTDTVFLGAFASIPAAQYSSATLTFSGAANITFLNDTGAPISLCPANKICSLVSNGASSNAIANISFTVSQNGVTGIGVDFNFSNAVSVSAATLVVNLSNNNVLSAFTLPRQGSNLASGQFDLIEDFTGVVSVSGNNVTITSPTRGTITAAANSNTIFDSDPTATLCNNATTLSGCVSANQIASVDAVLKSDGSLSIQEIEPLLATVQDTVEGIVVSINQNNQTQFTLVVTDLIPAALNSLIGGLNVGDGLTVNIPNPSPFLVDTKGLAIAANLANFANANNTSVMRLGQSVTVHVTAFTAAGGNTIASSTSNSVTLRWSRITATPVTPFTSNTFNLTGFPSYFFASGTAEVQAFAGTPGTRGTTNFDGIADASGLNASKPVALRTLFIENATNSANPAFFAVKVRQH
jgi:hypothetical protein